MISKLKMARIPISGAVIKVGKMKSIGGQLRKLCWSSDCFHSKYSKSVKRQIMRIHTSLNMHLFSYWLAPNSTSLFTNGDISCMIHKSLNESSPYKVGLKESQCGGRWQDSL